MQLLAWIKSYANHSNGQVFFDLDKYLMRTYKASVRVKVNGRTQVIATEIRAPNAQDARWLLWAMYGFHSIQVGPALQLRSDLSALPPIGWRPRIVEHKIT
jgi:predicted cobalt transporter CbtA